VLFVDCRPSAKLLKISCVSLFPQDRAVSQNDAWNSAKPRRELGFEVTVLLVNGREFASMA